MSSSSTNSSDDDKSKAKVRIFIRSPTTLIPEGFSVLANLDSSVLFLKQSIFETHPSKPNIKDQKLIYRGKVLKDSDLVINVLQEGLSTDQTFHLVVKPSFQTIAETTGMPIRPPSSNAVPTTTTATAQNIRFPQNQTLHPVQNSSMLINGNNLQQPPAYFYPNVPQYQYFVPPTLDPSQIQGQQNATIFNQQQEGMAAQMHNPFVMGFPLQYYVMINGMPHLIQMPFPNPQPQLYPYPQQYQFINQQQMGIAPAQQPLNAPQLHEQQDIGARNQRRLASLWLILKLSFLVYIFSNNASIERIILLCLLAMVIFLSQTGRLRVVRRRRQRIVFPMANEIIELPPVQENNRPTTLQDIEHALWTFVTSLIPSNPPDVMQQDDMM
ncbi:6988_t:CDS:2 [Entrophospora sp. SA101]|nr:6988_t:CDS:2 [Entrophospora sp. SA101]